MRESNKYHKFIGYYEKRLNSTAWSGILIGFEFDYDDRQTRKETKQLFPGFEFKGSSTYIMTQDKKASEIVPQDRIHIDGNISIITSIQDIEVQTLAGNRRNQRKKTYLIELEV